MLQESAFEITPCLNDGPLAQRARAVVSAARMLGSTRWAAVTRAWCVLYLFENMERIFAWDEDPVEALNQSLEKLADFLRAAAHSGFRDLDGPREKRARVASDRADIKELTGEHYGHLFKAFSPTSFWDEPAQLLRQRLERNGISVVELQDKQVLDAGCGGGRYSVAWRLLGARPVTGIDISATGIADARRRTQEIGIDGIIFEQGNVLELPFAEDMFEVVFSNGVLHHTTDWQQGVAELVRVLKPGGLGWLYLIQNPGGLFWDTVEILRAVMKDEHRDVSRVALRMLGVPANRVFYMLDHVMAPINVRLAPDEVERCLRASGATGIRRLERGTDFDPIEHIYQNEPDAILKYGVGENRYVFTKE